MWCKIWQTRTGLINYCSPFCEWVWNPKTLKCNNISLPVAPIFRFAAKTACLQIIQMWIVTSISMPTVSTPWRMEPPATPPRRSSTSQPGLLTSNDRMTIMRGGDVKSRSGTGIFFVTYSHNTCGWHEPTRWFNPLSTVTKSFHWCSLILGIVLFQQIWDNQIFLDMQNFQYLVDLQFCTISNNFIYLYV